MSDPKQKQAWEREESFPCGGIHPEPSLPAEVVTEPVVNETGSEGVSEVVPQQ